MLEYIKVINESKVLLESIFILNLYLITIYFSFNTKFNTVQNKIYNNNVVCDTSSQYIVKYAAK